MKKVSSNQTDAFKRKNALRYALGGEVTQPPVLGKTRAAADAAIDAEAVKGTSLQQPNMVAPSITAPPPAPAPTLTQGNYEASQLLRQQPNNSVMSRLRGTNTFQFGVGGAVPVEPAFREQGGPSKRRLGADSGIPGIPPAFAPGGSVGLDGLDDMLDDWQVSKGPQQLTGLSPVGAPQSMNGRLLSPGPTLDSSISPDTARSYALRARFSSPTENQDSYEFLTKTGMYARPGSEPSVRNPNDPVDYTMAGERRANQNNALRAQQAAAEQAKGPFIGRFPGDSRFEEGGPITAQHPPKQGKDNQVVLAAAGEYILPKATVDAMGGPNTLDNIVRATNGKEPNNANGSMLRAENGLGLPSDFEGYPGKISKSGAAARNVLGGASELGSKARAYAKPSGVGMKIAGGLGKVATHPLAVGAGLAASAAPSFVQPPEVHYNYLKSKGVDPMRLPMPAQISPNDTFFDKAGKVLGNAALTVAGTGFGMLPGDSPASFAAGKKTEIKTEKPPAAAQNTPVPASNAPSETSAAKAPEYSRLRGVMDGVNMAALMTPRGFTSEFGKMLANRGTNTAALANNRQQMAEQQLEWDRQKFGLQRDWDMRRFGMEYNTGRHDKTREFVHSNIEKTVGVLDDKGRLTNPLDVAKAKAQADATAATRSGGYAGMSADDQTRQLLNAAEIRQTINDNTGIVPTVRNWAMGRDPLRDPLTTEGMRPTGPVVKGALVDDVPTQMGQIGKSTYEGRGVIPTRPVPQYKLDDLELANRPKMARGGRVAKSKLRSGGC